MDHWQHCKNILCIRPDNMGDLLMTVPAIQALKSSFNCKITVLVSTMAAGVAAIMPAIDAVITFDLPWLKFDELPDGDQIAPLIAQLKTQEFDGCIVFNVYSQNPAPAILLAYLANIPLRAAYARENLYGLLTTWIPDPEPYQMIRHQVARDLALVAELGATDQPQKTQLRLAPFQSPLIENLEFKNYFVVHAGVSDPKRSYPTAQWIEFCRLLLSAFKLPIVLTGTAKDAKLVSEIAWEVAGTINLCEMLTVAQLGQIIADARALVAVNTGPVHLAAAVQTPVVVLYAQTNPQHTPWQVKNRVLPYSMSPTAQSKNEVIRFVNEKYYQQYVPYPSAKQVLNQLQELLAEP
jgi:ADP-heptose:LPS heptosyltransferase